MHNYVHAYYTYRWSHMYYHLRHNHKQINININPLNVLKKPQVGQLHTPSKQILTNFPSNSDFISTNYFFSDSHEDTRGEQGQLESDRKVPPCFYCDYLCIVSNYTQDGEAVMVAPGISLPKTQVNEISWSHSHYCARDSMLDVQVKYMFVQTLYVQCWLCCVNSFN